MISRTDYILGTCLRQGLAEPKNQKTNGHLESAWQCGNDCFSNNFLCRNTCQ